MEACESEEVTAMAAFSTEVTVSTGWAPVATVELAGPVSIPVG